MEIDNVSNEMEKGKSGDLKMKKDGEWRVKSVE